MRSFRERGALQPARHCDLVVKILDDIVRLAIEAIRRFMVVRVLVQRRQCERGAITRFERGVGVRKHRSCVRHGGANVAFALHEKRQRRFALGDQAQCVRPRGPRAARRTSAVARRQIASKNRCRLRVHRRSAASTGAAHRPASDSRRRERALGFGHPAQPGKQHGTILQQANAFSDLSPRRQRCAD